jgi:hypothetical protein
MLMDLMICDGRHLSLCGHLRLRAFMAGRLRPTA